MPRAHTQAKRGFDLATRNSVDARSWEFFTWPTTWAFLARGLLGTLASAAMAAVIALTLGLVLLVIAAVPLTINLLAGLPFRIYWRNIAVMVVPFLYLLAALFKRSEKKPATQATTTAYTPVSPAPQAAPVAQPVAQPESKLQTDEGKQA